jgi:hypothetical protein
LVLSSPTFSEDFLGYGIWFFGKNAFMTGIRRAIKIPSQKER